MAIEPDADPSAELKWLRHNQGALDARLQRVEESLVFRTLRAIGTFYQSNFGGGAAVSTGAYRTWAERHARGRIAPDPQWSYQPTIDIAVKGGDVESLKAQTYSDWKLDGAGGDYWAELRSGVVLAPDALACAVAAMQAARPARIYFDHEERDESGAAARPVFKPDWSPVLMESCDYLGDFVLHWREGPGATAHVPRVAYSSRRRPRIVHTEMQPAGRPLVSILICTRNADLLSRCLAALRARTDYTSVEIVVVHHAGSADDGRIEHIAQDCGAKIVRYDRPFNFSEMNNLGAAAAAGELLLFLNDDVEPLDSKWLERMAAWLERPEIGAVGAKLLYPNGAIQHAGIATWEMDGAGHPGRNLTGSDIWPWLDATREVTAVTGACLGVRRADFESVGGFDPQFPVNFNDVDLCLRLRERGLSIVYDAGAVLQHDESRTRARGVHFDERRRFYLRWHERVDRVDPYYSPHLAQNNENLTLRER